MAGLRSPNTVNSSFDVQSGTLSMQPGSQWGMRLSLQSSWGRDLRPAFGKMGVYVCVLP